MVQVTINGERLFANDKTFSTGSRGYNANGKVLIDGKKYQVNCNIIEIGSKPGSEAKQPQNGPVKDVTATKKAANF